MRPGLVLGAVLVAAILVIGIPMTLRQQLPDVNPPTASSSASIGYADVTVKVGIQFDSSSFNNNVLKDFDQVKLVATLGASFTTSEHLNAPSEPASIFEWPKATAATTCIGTATITMTGPIDGVAQQTTAEKIFGVGDTVTFAWGHTYFASQGEVGTTIQVHVRGCYSYSAVTTDGVTNQIGNFDRSGWVFDGVNEG
jgi:hypothetical protein